MAEFSIMPANARTHENELNKYAGLLAGYSGQVIDIRNSLGKMGNSTERIKAALKQTADQMTDEQRSMKDFSTKLIDIITVYENTERNICGQTSVAPQEPNGAGVADALGAIDDILDSLWQKIKEDLANPDRGIILALFAGMGLSGIENLLLLYMLPDDVRNYILNALSQAVLGDFYGGDGNLLGTALSVGIGFIPYVGQIADIRDLIADIYNLIDGGPTADEWVALGFTLVGIIPGIGDFLKHGDEAGDLMKGLFKNFDNVDEIADGVKGFMKKGDDVFSAVAKKLDDLKRGTGDIMDRVIESNSVSEAIRDGINGAGDWIKNTDIYKGLDDWLGKKLKVGSGEYEKSAKDLLEGIVDEYKEDMEEDLVNKLLDWITGSDGQQAAAAT